jgi:aminoglycoside phosphotransferase family enzyme/predicted kinase
MQEEVVAALARPETYAHRPAHVEHVQTHISHVFLAGPYVYKLKKAVRFPFLDFSTPERRRHYAEEEVRLNRRLAAAVYRGVLPVTREADGRLALAGAGAPIEHVVWMRRLPAERMLNVLARRGEPLEARLDALAARLAAFHAAAPTGAAVAAHADPERIEDEWRSNVAELRPFVGRLLAAEDHEVLADFGPTFVRRHDTLLRARQHAGRIREGHGDLHAEHICFVDEPVPGAPGDPPLPPDIYVFDCIEFSRAFRSTDVAAEVAFLAMDLDALGHPALARRFATAYAQAASDPDLHHLLRFYACHRAAIRGKVEGLASEEAEVAAPARAAAAERARQYLALAGRYAWGAGGPVLIAVGGLSGTGKTAVARAVAEATGFRLLASDPLRKARAGLRPEEPGPPALYTPAARAAVYAALLAQADAALAAGESVILDATWTRRTDRAGLAELARRHRRPWLLVVCTASETVVRERLARRALEPSVSDARWETYLAQRAAFAPPGPDEPHVVIETSGTAAATRSIVLRALWRWRQGRLR